MSDKMRNAEDLVQAGKSFALAGCMLYLIGFILFIVFIVIFAMISTPNPYGP